MIVRFALVSLIALTGTLAHAGDVAPGKTLRAAYLATNPTQATRDAASGEMRGPAPALARELARRENLELVLKPISSPPAVIDAVRSGEADIGFVAYEATRLGTVDFSQVYMLVRQSFLVREDSPIRSVADIDRAGQAIAGTVNDSITLCMKRVLKHASVVEVPNDPAEIGKALAARSIAAFGANRQRLTAMMKAAPGTRILADDFFSVPQNIIVPKDRPAALAVVNAVIDEMRASGALQRAIEAGGASGVALAPAGVKAGCPG